LLYTEKFLSFSCLPLTEMHHNHKALLALATIILLFTLFTVMFHSEDALTSAMVKDSIACYEDNDCNDRIDCTEDLCRNPGSVNSICVNKVKEECE